jgi:hypothetical protein
MYRAYNNSIYVYSNDIKDLLIYDTIEELVPNFGWVVI